MLKKTLLLAALLVAVSFTTVFARMDKMGRGSMMGMGMGMGMMHNPEMCILNAEKIGLSDEQLTKFKALHFEHKKRLISLNAEKDLKNLELDQLLNKKEKDLGAIEEKLKEVYDTKMKIKMERIKKHLEVEKLLTYEQMEKLQELMMGNMMKMKTGIMKGTGGMMGKGKKGGMMMKMMDPGSSKMSSDDDKDKDKDKDEMKMESEEESYEEESYEDY